MSVPLAPKDEMEFILDQIAVKEAAGKEETRYLPPTMDGDLLVSGVMVSEGVVVQKKVAKAAESEVVDKESGGDKEETDNVVPDVLGSEDVVQSTEESAIDKDGAVEREDGSKEVCLAEGDEEVASVCVEEVGVTSGGRANDDDLMLDAIGGVSLEPP